MSTALEQALAGIDAAIAECAAEQERVREKLTNLEARAEGLSEARTAISGLVGGEPVEADGGRADRPAQTPTKKAAKKSAAKRGRKKPDFGGPVDCPDCGRTLKTKNAIGPHRRACPGANIEKPAEKATCVCGRTFPSHMSMATHQRTCSTFNPKPPPAEHVCPICEQKFLTKGDLARHRVDANHYSDEELAAENETPEVAA